MCIVPTSQSLALALSLLFHLSTLIWLVPLKTLFHPSRSYLLFWKLTLVTWGGLDLCVELRRPCLLIVEAGYANWSPLTVSDSLTISSSLEESRSVSMVSSTLGSRLGSHLGRTPHSWYEATLSLSFEKLTKGTPGVLSGPTTKRLLLCISDCTS